MRAPTLSGPLLLILSLFCFSFSFAQPALPLRTLTITVTQPIHFGSFCVTGGSGGTVTLGHDGNRSSTGEIILLDVPPFAQSAIFEIKLCLSRTVMFMFDPPVIQLTGTGGSLSLQLGPTDKGVSGSSFLINGDCNFVTTLRVGGTLTTIGSPLPGSYSGNFGINFIQQ